jgi:putative ABC transport system ATP-binding protein
VTAGNEVRPPSFELRDVVAGPIEHPIISLSIDIPCDGITAVVGPSGSGKSTLLRLLNRLDDPTSGTVSYQGRDLVDWDPAELRRKVGMVFQRPPLFAGSVFDNFTVADGSVSTERAAHVLEHVGLDADLLERPADRLSGGEAQRMCVARALLTEPEVLLADEPTAALDGSARITVEDLAMGIARDGVPIVWITHDTAQLHRLADHAIVIARGGLAAFGHLDDLIDHDDALVRELVGAP